MGLPWGGLASSPNSPCPLFSLWSLFSVSFPSHGGIPEAPSPLSFNMEAAGPV